MGSNFNRGDLSVNFESYKVFYLVATLASTTLAAEALFLTQPAVSKSIHHLEEEMGCVLFLRTQKGMVMTEEGKELYSYISQAYESIIKGQKKVRQMMKMQRGAIRIGTDEMTVHFDLLPRLEHFNRDYPNIKMNVTSYSRATLLRALKDGEIDFGAAVCGDEVFENVERIELNYVHCCFIVGSRYQEMTQRSWTLSEILEYPVISLVKGMSARKHLDDFFLENGLNFYPDIELTTTTLIVPFAERNLGVGIVAQNFAEEALAAGRVFKLDVKPAIPSRRTCLLIGKKTQISLAARRFLSDIVGKNENEKKL